MLKIKKVRVAVAGKKRIEINDLPNIRVLYMG